jgi:hypothetical protein
LGLACFPSRSRTGFEGKLAHRPLDPTKTGQSISFSLIGSSTVAKARRAPLAIGFPETSRIRGRSALGFAPHVAASARRSSRGPGRALRIIAAHPNGSERRDRRSIPAGRGQHFRRRPTGVAGYRRIDFRANQKSAADLGQELSYRPRPEPPDSLDIARESKIREDVLLCTRYACGTRRPPSNSPDMYQARAGYGQIPLGHWCSGSLVVAYKGVQVTFEIKPAAAKEHTARPFSLRAHVASAFGWHPRY